MNTILLKKTSSTNSNSLLQNKLLLLFLFAFSSLVSEAQVFSSAGPYQNFEGFAAKATLTGQTPPWTFSGASSTASTAGSSRSGAFYGTIVGAGQYIQTPLITENINTFSCWIRGANATTTTYEIQWSTNATFPVGYTTTLTGGTLSTLATMVYNQVQINGSAFTNSNGQSGSVGFGAATSIYIRIKVISGPGIFVDDVSWISNDTSKNSIIVPGLGNTYCNTITLADPTLSTSPAYYTLYDNGGLDDSYNNAQKHTLSFIPYTSTGYSAKLTLNSSFTLGAGDTFGVYSGAATGANPPAATMLAPTNTLTYSAGPPVGPSYTSCASDGSLSVQFNSDATTVASGFSFKVECVAYTPPAIVATQPSATPVSYCVGATATALTVAASGSIIGPTYQWYSNTSNSNSGGSVITGATLASYTPLTTIAGTTYYYCVITDTVCTRSETSAVSGGISVTAYPAAVTVSLSGTYCASTTLTASNGSSGTIYWQNTTTGGTSTSTPSASQVVATTGTYYFRALAGASCWGTEGSATVTINTPIAITGQPSATTQSLCVGATASAFSVTATGTGVTYQWYSNTSNSNTGGTLISGATAASYQPLTAVGNVGTTYYYCTVSGTAPCTAVTSSVSGGVTVTDYPGTVVVSTPGTYCSSTTLTASNGGSGTIYWQNTASGSTSTTTPSSSQVVTVSGTYFFRALAGSSCWGTEGSATVTINTPPASAPVATAATSLANTSFVANWVAVTGASGYYLDVATDAAFTTMVSGFSNLSVGNVTTYSVTGLTSNTTYYYRVRVTNGCLNATNSNTINCTTTAVVITYCTPTYSSGDTGYGDQITNVTLGTLNNSTGASASPYYTFYNAVTVPNLYQGSTKTISITVGSDSNQYVAVWIDYNHNGTFETSEGVVASTNAGSNGTTVLTLTVPIGAVLGNTRMRVRGGDDYALTTAMACGASNSNFGETEDYTVNIIALPPCAVSNAITALLATNLNATSATLNWYDPNLTPSSSYDYFYSTSSAATPSITGNVTGVTSVNLTGLTSLATYYFWVRSDCSGTTGSWVGPYSFTLVNLDIINMHNGSINTCNAKFYDSQGPSSSYLVGEYYVFTIYPGTAGSSVKAIFNAFASEDSYDYLNVYNGTSTASPLLGYYTGTNMSAGQTFLSTDSSGALTFEFYSDSYCCTDIGWDANISCVPVPAITSFSPSNMCANASPAPTVIITGLNFTAVTAVTFNGVVLPTSAYTVTDSSHISVVIPSGTVTGPIGVTTIQGSALSGTSFIVNQSPAAPNAGSDMAFCQGTTNTTAFNATASASASNVLSNAIGNSPVSGFTLPFTTRYDDAKSQFLILASELSAAGIFAGNLTSVAFNVDGRNGQVMNNFNLSLKTTAATTLTAFDATGLTNVFSGSYTVPAVGWQTITFTTPFAWDGTSNIIVQICFDNNDGVHSQSSTVKYSSVSGNRTAYADVRCGGRFSTCDHTVNTTAGCSLSSANLTSYIPNVKFGYTPAITYSWTPTTGLSNPAILAPIANPSATTTYTLAAAYANGCSVTDDVIVTVNQKPTLTSSLAVSALCVSASAQAASLNYTATTNSPTSYSIVWNALAHTAGFADQATTTLAFVAGAGTITGITIPANVVPNQYTGSLTITNAGGCNTSYTITVNIGKLWNGGTSNDWGYANNWTPSGVPTSSDCVVIPFGTPNSPEISVNAFAGNLTINTSASLSVDSGVAFKVQDFVKTDGTLTMNNSASLIQINNVPNSGSGNMIYKRDVVNLHGYDYVYWSSPVASQPINNLYSTPALGYKYYWDTLVDNGNGTGGNISQGNWAVASGNMSIGKGYIIRGSTSYGWTGNLTSTFTGIPNNGSIAVPIVRGSYQGVIPYIGINGVPIAKTDDNMNLIGNPYPSAVNAIDFLNANSNIDGYVYLWTHNTSPSSTTNPFYSAFSSNYFTSDYLSYNSSGSSAGPGTFNGYIAAGQGFFVSMVDGFQDASQTVSFTNSMRSNASPSYSNSQFYKADQVALSSTEITKNRIWIDLIDSNSISSRILVGYIDGATNLKDRNFDAYAKVANANILYSLIGDESQVIQGRALPFDENDQVPIGYHAQTSGNFTVAIAAVDGLFEQGQSIYLEDKLLNVIYDLRQAPYVFATAAGTFNDRFVLRYTNSNLSNEQFATHSVAAFIANQKLQIKASSVITSVQIYDVAGKLIQTYAPTVKALEVTEDFPFANGVYFAKIKLDDGSQILQKVMN